MPRPTKRAAAARLAATYAALKRRRTVTTIFEDLEASANSSLEDSGTPDTLHSEIQVDSLSNDAIESSESESDAQSEGMLSEEEDEYPIKQPEAGWKKAEKLLHSYSKM